MNAARNTLNPAALEATVRLLAGRLEEHRAELNRLNVYPVADSDTGDNLVATVRAVIEQIAGARRTDPIDTIATGALLGGRGSSGVMFGQALRGFVTNLPDPCGADGLASALTAAAAAARDAIADPVEGTMLTVADDAARQARATATASVTEVARAAAEEGRRSLLRTPDLLPSLAEAGVVDAGGLGYVLFLDALAEAITGVAAAPLQLRQPQRPAFECDGNGGGRYEVICLVAADEEQLASLRERWRSLGDTVAIAGSEDIWRCHVHTDDVDGALAAARQAGRVSDVEITDLDRQRGVQ
jgi:uncharacterized protein